MAREGRGVAGSPRRPSVKDYRGVRIEGVRKIFQQRGQELDDDDSDGDDSSITCPYM